MKKAVLKIIFMISDVFWWLLDAIEILLGALEVLANLALRIMIFFVIGLAAWIAYITVIYEKKYEFALNCSRLSSNGIEEIYLGFARASMLDFGDWLVQEADEPYSSSATGSSSYGRLDEVDDYLISHNPHTADPVRRLNRSTLILTEDYEYYSFLDKTYVCEDLPLSEFEERRRIARLPVAVR